MTDDEIDTSDIPEADDGFFERATLRKIEGKAAVVLNIDCDVLEWFQQQDGEYHRLVNIALRDYAESHR